ncbi:MAG: hypothetical protein WAV98_02650 [Minisyncoccia bacterium]
MKYVPSRVYEFFYRLFRITVRRIIKYSSDPRPSSYPYVSGDGFRKLAKFVYDDVLKNVIPEEVKEGDIIFIGNSLMRRFAKDIHPKIKNKYVLITNNGDEPVDDITFSLLGDKVIKWYGINVLIKNSKVVSMPLGIENKWMYYNGITLWFDLIRKRKNLPNKNKIFYGFTTHTNLAERWPALDVLEDNKYTETIIKWLSFKKYLELLVTYRFVASPPGSSVEGIRTWDAVYLGIVPIVKNSITMEYFKKIGLPIWVVDDWHELDTVNEEILDKKFKEIRGNYNEEVLWMDYWIDKIKNLKD